MKKIFKSFVMLVMMGFVPVMTSCQGLIDAIIGSEDTPSSTTPTVVHITGVSISGAGIQNGTATISVGSTLQLTATVTPSNTSETALNWTSSDTSVLTVSDSGLLTALKAGTVTVKVTSAIDAQVWAQITVNVEDGSINVNTNPVDQSHADTR
jgi:uncharacterized protein YjdB